MGASLVSSTSSIHFGRGRLAALDLTGCARRVLATAQHAAVRSCYIHRE